jgi:LmbE family N-acetylglucosaminyl deacetylase
MGGTLAFYSHKGVDVTLVCATRGEAGDVNEELLREYSSIGDLREAELHCASKKLGLKEVFFLDYRDSGMQGTKDNFHPRALIQVPIERLASDIAYYIRGVMPQVVITFDPIGGYGHPDHVRIHKATIKAFELAGEQSFHCRGLPLFQPQKLYFHILPSCFLKIIVKLMPLFGQDPHHFGKNKDIDLVAVLENDYPVGAKINCKSVAKVRDEAAACYVSQGGEQKSGYIVLWLRRLFLNVETFMRSFPPAEGKRLERDLFEGI